MIPDARLLAKSYPDRLEEWDTCLFQVLRVPIAVVPKSIRCGPGGDYYFVATFNVVMHAAAVFGHSNNYNDSPEEPVIIPCFPRDTFL